MSGDPGDRTISETPRGAASRKLGVGSLPSRYRVLDILGTGGMGTVYRAHDTTLGRDVAIKVIEKEQLSGPDKTQQRERFVREAQAAARLAHPNIVTVHDVDPEAGWLVMEVVEGEALRDLHDRGRLSPTTIREIAAAVLSGLDAAHAAGIVHRDIKPSNIIVGPTGKVTVVDFGVARLVLADLTRTGENVGTPAYMAPEQIRGAAVDGRTDLYGLGATLYEIVMGERILAFESPSPAIAARVRAACGVERGLADVIVRCLQGDPADRFASARDALAALLDPPPPALPPRRRWAVPMLVAGVAAAGIATGIAMKRYAGGDRAVDRRLADAFAISQRGEHERAAVLLEAYLVEHPGDPDALVAKLLSDWWQTGATDVMVGRAVGARLRPAQRALVHGIDLIAHRREIEAIGYLEQADREHPGTVEIQFALGEARWHGQRVADGAATLENAFAIDPRWQMALHHPIEYRLSRGEAGRLKPIADRMRRVDPAMAGALDCKIAIGERRYADAETIAAAALAANRPVAELYICMSHARTLQGRLDDGMQSAKQAFDEWPIDLREWGGFVTYAETFLYRGQLDEYLDLVRDKPSRQRTLALALWRPTPTLTETTPAGSGMRMPPLGAVVWIICGWLQHRDEVAVYATYPEPEVTAFGTALWAETRGDTATAIARYREALAVPAKGDVRMLVAHHLARVLWRTGDKAGAAAACVEVISPTLYQPYRAIVLPDCLLWSGDPAMWRRLVDAWKGGFAHPAVVEARARLGE